MRSCRTLTEAKRFKRQADAGDVRPGARQPFKRYAAMWIDGYAGRTARGVGDSTRATYRDAIERYAVPFFGTVRRDAIDPPMVRAYITHLAAKGLAPASVRRYFAPVRALLATAHDDGVISPNPSAGIRVVVPDRRSAPGRPRRADARADAEASRRGAE